MSEGTSFLLFLIIFNYFVMFSTTVVFKYCWLEMILLYSKVINPCAYRCFQNYSELVL